MANTIRLSGTKQQCKELGYFRFNSRCTLMCMRTVEQSGAQVNAPEPEQRRVQRFLGRVHERTYFLVCRFEFTVLTVVSPGVLILFCLELVLCFPGWRAKATPAAISPLVIRIRVYHAIRLLVAMLSRNSGLHLGVPTHRGNMYLLILLVSVLVVQFLWSVSTHSKRPRSSAAESAGFTCVLAV